MYEKLMEEIDKISRDFLKDDVEFRYTDSGRRLDSREPDMITGQVVNTIKLYADVKTPSIIWTPIDEYFTKSKFFKSVDPTWRAIATGTYEAVKDFSEAKLKDLLYKIARSRPVKEVELSGDFSVIMPEEKFWAVQVIKTLLGNAEPKPKLTVKRETHSPEYIEAYNKIIKACGSRKKCDDDQVLDILSGIPGGDDAPGGDM